jgi:hypothetical protein
MEDPGCREKGGSRLPQEGLPVRKIKEVLRLHALGLSQRQIALSAIENTEHKTFDHARVVLR